MHLFISSLNYLNLHSPVKGTPSWPESCVSKLLDDARLVATWWERRETREERAAEMLALAHGLGSAQ